MLDKASRLKLSNASSVDLSKACGLFAIPKLIEADRLIVDGRPANLCVDLDCRWLCMLASASTLVDIELPEQEELRTSGEDVRDFYHQFRVSDDRAMQYTLIDTFRPAELQHLRSFTPELWKCSAVAASLATLAMGDTNAVSFGQASHLGLVFASNAILPQQLLTLRNRIPRSPLMLGIVIDDLVVIERVASGMPLTEHTCHSPQVMACLKGAYAAAGLPTHDKKAFALVSDASFWGAEMLGAVGLVRPSWTRIVPLAFLSLAAASLPAISVPLLETLAGSWVSALTFRRRGLCVLQEIYRSQHGRSQADLVAVTCPLRRELFTVCTLSPLWGTDLRAQRLLAVAVVANASDLGPRDHLQAKTVLDEATVAAAHQQENPDPDEVLTVPGLAQGDFRAGQDSHDDFDTEDLAWSENSILPCLTTASDDPRGRAAPRSYEGKASSDTQSRWISDGRKYAPWRYESRNMWSDTAGRKCMATPRIKEQLHHVPVDWTQSLSEHKIETQSIGERLARRSRQAVFHLQPVLRQPRQGRTPTRTLRPRSQFHQHRGGDLADRAIAGRPGRAVGPLRPRPHDHHQRQMLPRLKAGPRQWLPLWQRARQALPAIRKQMTKDMQSLADELHDQTQDWFAGLKPHIRAAYDNGKGEPVMSVPL